MEVIGGIVQNLLHPRLKNLQHDVWTRRNLFYDGWYLPTYEIFSLNVLILHVHDVDDDASELSSLTGRSSYDLRLTARVLGRESSRTSSEGAGGKKRSPEQTVWR